MLTGNKGEWSEVYVLFKILGDGKIVLGNELLQAIESDFFTVSRVTRKEDQSERVFVRGQEYVTFQVDDRKYSIPVNDFLDQASALLARIRTADGAFTAEDAERFLASLMCSRIKADSGSKKDIEVTVLERGSGTELPLGFSIKSLLGSAPTLLNAGRTTNFIFRITNFNPTEHEVDSINSIDTKDKIQERIRAIIGRGGWLEFVSLENASFAGNLTMIDSLMPDIMAAMVLQYYSSNLSWVHELTERIASSNPVNFKAEHNHTFYEYKVKHLLTEIALGMTPGTVWNGLHNATGGYLVVRRDGEVLCYHIVKRDLFQDYLYANTRFESASSNRHDYGRIYRDNEECFIKLNLQIRFDM